MDSVKPDSMMGEMEKGEEGKDEREREREKKREREREGDRGDLGRYHK